MKTLSWGFSLGIFVPIFSHAAGLETSDQTVLPFLESDHYVELSYGELYADVSGRLAQQEQLKQIGVENFSTGNLVDDYRFINAAAKMQLTPEFSLGLIYDQPFGVHASYEYKPHSDLGDKLLESGKFDFNSQNITMLFGYQPTKNWNFYAGTAYQQFDGHLNVFGENYSIMSGYDAKFYQSSGQGWVTGFSYQIPEYAMKAALTYRTKIKHETIVEEKLSGQTIDFTPLKKTNIETPQSINFDFQTALSNKYFLYSSIRWVNWKDFKIQPTQFGALLDYFIQLYPESLQHFNLIEYKNDQWSAKLGVVHALTDKWAGVVDVLWDSGVGNPAGTLNPSDGYTGLGLAAIYKPRKNFFVAYGVKYVKFAKAKIADLNFNNPITQNPNLTGVGNNNALAQGIKFGYRF